MILGLDAAAVSAVCGQRDMGQRTGER